MNRHTEASHGSVEFIPGMAYKFQQLVLLTRIWITYVLFLNKYIM